MTNVTEWNGRMYDCKKRTRRERHSKSTELQTDDRLEVETNGSEEQSEKQLLFSIKN